MLNNLINSKKHLIIILVCVTIMLSQIFTHGIINGHDVFVHMFRIVGYSQNILSGDIFSKIDYNYINGFGYGTGIFYPQLNILFPTLIYLVIHNVSISIKLFIYFNTLLSAMFMYFYLKEKIKNNNSALVGSLLYILAPYTYIQAMFRCSIGEMTVFLSLPMIFWGLDRIFENKKYGNLLVILGGIYVLQSHIISTIFTLIFVGIYLLLNVKKLLNKRILKNLIICCLTIILISLYFLVPLIEHYKLNGYNLLTASNEPHKKIVYFTQLFFSIGNFGRNVDGNGIFNEMPYTISILIVSIILSLPYIINKFSRNDKKEVIRILLIGIIIIIMMLCPMVWRHIKYIDIIQFPWRLLSYCVFFLSIAATYIFSKYNIKDRLFPLILCLIIMLSFIQLNNYIINTPVESEIGYDLNEVISNQVVNNPENINLRNAMGSKNDYLPVECDIKYIASRGNSLIVNKGKLKSVKNYKFKNGLISADIKIEGDTKIELPLIYYLGYNITLDGKKIDYVKDKNGFIEINVKKSGNLKVKYTGTKLDVCANIISVISVVLFIGYYIFILIKKRINLCKK